jgi:hypothetical protein
MSLPVMGSAIASSKKECKRDNHACGWLAKSALFDRLSDRSN